jgi:hypothetical protein
MSQEWLNIQSFFSDHDLIGAINDLSIHLKQEQAGIKDSDRADRAQKARGLLRDFLTRLSEADSEEGKDLLLGTDSRFQNLADAFAAARQEGGRFHSLLVREGAASVVSLLEAKDPEKTKELLESLGDLRRIVEQHQQTDASVILEET